MPNSNAERLRAHYEVLNLEPGSPLNEVREAYIRMRNMFTTQNQALYSLMGDEDIQTSVDQIENAFKTLNDELSRQQIAQTHGFTPIDVERPQPIETPKQLKASASRGDDYLNRLSEMIAQSDPGDGDLYRRLREVAQVTEDEMQDRTKICIEYIRAIEGNSFDRLPKAIFVKGFLRSYFKYLAIPEGESLVKAFANRLDAWQLEQA